jgi:hypothetical protein
MSSYSTNSATEQALLIFLMLLPHYQCPATRRAINLDDPRVRCRSQALKLENLADQGMVMSECDRKLGFQVSARR